MTHTCRVRRAVQRGNLPLKLAICYEAPLVVVRRLYDEYPAAIDAIDKVPCRSNCLRGLCVPACLTVQNIPCRGQWGENVLHAAVACNPSLDVLKFLVATKPALAQQSNKVRRAAGRIVCLRDPPHSHMLAST